MLRSKTSLTIRHHSFTMAAIPKPGSSHLVCLSRLATARLWYWRLGPDQQLSHWSCHGWLARRSKVWRGEFEQPTAPLESRDVKLPTHLIHRSSLTSATRAPATSVSPCASSTNVVVATRMQVSLAPRHGPRYRMTLPIDSIRITFLSLRSKLLPFSCIASGSRPDEVPLQEALAQRNPQRRAHARLDDAQEQEAQPMGQGTVRTFQDGRFRTRLKDVDAQWQPRFVAHRAESQLLPG